MLQQPGDKRVVEALQRLRYHDDWNTVREWLEGELRRIREGNDNRIEEVPLRMGQGAAQALRDLFAYQDDAEATIRRIRDRQSAGTVHRPTASR